MRIFALALALAVTAVWADDVPPPRSVEDILAVLDQYKPDPAKVTERKRAAELPPPRTTDKPQLAEFYFDRSHARGGLGMVNKQIEDLRIAAQLAAGTMSGRPPRRSAARGRPDLESSILNQLTHSEMAGGNFRNAVQVAQRRLQAMQSQSNPRPNVLITSYVNLAVASAQVGDVAAAKAALSRGEAFSSDRTRSLNSGRWVSLIEHARGRIYLSEGKYPDAEAALRKAVQAFDKQRRAERAQRTEGEEEARPGFYRALRNEGAAALGRAMMQQGRLADAEAAMRDGLLNNLSFFGRYSPQTAASLNGLSEVLAEEGRFREAALISAAAIDSLEHSGAAAESLQLATARRGHGAALVAHGEWAAAISVFERMQQGLAGDPVLARQFGNGEINWGYALVRTGQAKRAVPMLADLLDSQEKRLGDKDRSVAELRGYFALALAADGDRDRALAEFRHAVPQLLDAARADQSSETGGTARWMRTTNVLEAYLELLSKTPGVDAAAEAFRVADVARGSSVQRALSESAARGAIRDPALAAVARSEQDAQHRIGALTELVSRLLTAAPEQQLDKTVQDARRELDGLRAEQAKLRKEIQRRFPDYAALTSPQPPAVADVQAALRPGEALVSIYVAPEQTYVWALQQKGAPAFASVALGRQAIAQRVAHLREALDIADASLANFPRFDLAASYALYSDILKPVEPALAGATSLLIVPHGALGHLPFAVLTTEPHVLKPDPAAAFETYKDAPWLIKRAAITQLPSVGTLSTLRRAGQPTRGRREFLGIGDPMFTKTQPAPLASGPVTRGVRLRNLAVAKVQSKTVVEASDEDDAETDTKPVAVAVNNSSGMAQLAPLPDTSEEILRIADVLHADTGEDVFLRLRANESIIKKLDLSKRRVIAFATHGLVPGDLNGLTQPALALSSPDVVGGTDDGLLTMEEILALKLDADWVVLSACNTASGEGAGAEAVSGLGRAFFYAGARALLVSNWPVETTSARMLTTGIFRLQAEKPGLSRAEALRQTMLALMNSPGPENGSWGFTYAHPMFWAPFSLVGEGGTQ